jgi:hypothetical protein
VPDVSEQRAEYLLPSDHRTSRNVPTMIFDSQAWVPATAYDAACNREASDPASVLAALLAESPEATVAALEALLTSDEAHIAAAAVVGARERLSPTGIRALDTSEAALRAACRSLLSKAPKGDGDA